MIILKEKISRSAKIYPDVDIGIGTIIGEYSIIGKPYRLVSEKEYPAKNKTQIEKDCQIGSHVIILKGSHISEKSNIEDFAKIEQDVEIGKNCYIIYGSQICNDATIGDNCIIAGFICERAIIGNGVRIFGKLIHNQLDPTSDWDETSEPSPIIEDNVFIGFDSKVIGKVRIEEYAYVCSGAIVTENVLSYYVAYNVNQQIHYKKWKGTLKNSAFFRGEKNGRKPEKD